MDPGSLLLTLHGALTLQPGVQPAAGSETRLRGKSRFCRFLVCNSRTERFSSRQTLVTHMRTYPAPS